MVVGLLWKAASPRASSHQSNCLYIPVLQPKLAPSLPLVQLLVERGADVHARTDPASPGFPGATAIHFASGSPDIEAFLLSHGLQSAEYGKLERLMSSTAKQ